MKGWFGIMLLCEITKVSRASCLLEKPYLFCRSFPKDYEENLESIIFLTEEVVEINSTLFSSENLKSVKSLTLANSKIRMIESGAFQNFRGLNRLSLYQNNLNTILPSWFDDPSHLENLTISKNKITEVQPQMLAGFSGLTVLDMNSNFITKIASQSFTSLSKLKYLNLYNNQISYLPWDLLIHLHNATFHLGLNPWNCSCELQGFSIFLQELINASKLADAAEVICAYPLHLNGNNVWNVSFTNCSLDFISTPNENSFQKLTLPLLLAVLVITLFISLLFVLWKKKQEKKQVTPQKRGRELMTGNCIERKHADGEIKPPMIQNKTTIGRSKSASAIMFREEFLQSGTRENVLQTSTQMEKRPGQPHIHDKTKIIKYEDGDIPCDITENNMGLWSYYRLRSGNKNSSQAISSLRTSKTHVVDLVMNRSTNVDFSGHRRDNMVSQMPTISTQYVRAKDQAAITYTNVESMEPLVYLSVNTISENPVVTSSTHKEITRAYENFRPRCIRRTLSWPREKVQSSQDSKDSYENFLKTLGLSPNPGIKCLGKKEIENDTIQDTKYENQLSMITIPKDKNDDFTKSNLEKESTVDVTFAKNEKEESKCQEGFNRGMSSTRKVYQRSSNNKNVQRKHTTSPEPRGQRGDLNSQESDRSTIRTTPDDDSLLDNNEYNFIDLLHEVVENHGRWTRQRWRQIHQQKPSRSLSPQ